jgi:hypothetical protein
LILPSPEGKKAQRGCPEKSDKPLSPNNIPASRAAPYLE